ncbi:SpoIIE family protein phosphatase [Streptomyces sp. NPDC004327]|uniref:SpoIIE family protein phosphatase n=1 Tax=Streptomyces sp. NPDC004327 TaxID=3364699 RepID=UPI0036CAF233
MTAGYEIATRYDIRMQREESRDGGETSATCLYAIYDPVSRQCSLASAGHIPRTVVTPSTAGEATRNSNVAELPEVPIGPPLGLVGLPFETAEFELPKGSLLVQHTDGLIAGRTPDVDLGIATLHDVLTSAPESLEATCDQLLTALLPGRPADDVALLVARTRTLDPDHVAAIDLPSDPVAVSGTRRFASNVLATWGLEEVSFVMELIISELVTNAISYGKSPVQLRLILHSTLTCEVSDASGTAPHMRRARIFDEGGRGPAPGGSAHRALGHATLSSGKGHLGRTSPSGGQRAERRRRVTPRAARRGPSLPKPSVHRASVKATVSTD